jgi:hypothetical protein
MHTFEMTKCKAKKKIDPILNIYNESKYQKYQKTYKNDEPDESL